MNNSATNLHFHKLGHGPNILLTFHGIGQDGSTCFKPFFDKLGNYYTIYAFDLFFHGQSNPAENDPSFSEPELITKKLWKEIIQGFLVDNNISRFDIAGFSMGGRFVLATLEDFSDRIDHAFLIAPDGISKHPLYSFATSFAPARRIFRRCMKYPKTFFRTVSLLTKAGIVNPSLHRFTQSVLNTPEKRQTIFNSWLAFRSLHFDIPKLYAKLRAEKIDLFLFIGKYDKLLPPAAVKKLSDLMPEKNYLILQSGHGALVEKVATFLAEKFNA